MLEKQPTNLQESGVKVSPETMKKTVEDLKREQAQFEATIQELKNYEASAKSGNPVSLDDFKRNRAKIQAFEGMLAEVTEAIKIKGNENAFDDALRATGEMRTADRLDKRRAA